MALPDFYRQVLHLMNKMNIPPPFDKNCIPGVFEVSRDKVDDTKEQEKIEGVEEDEEEASSPDEYEHKVSQKEQADIAESQFLIQSHTDSKIGTDQSQSNRNKSTILRSKRRLLNPDIFKTKKQHTGNDTERHDTISRLQLEKMRLPPPGSLSML